MKICNKSNASMCLSPQHSTSPLKDDQDKHNYVVSKDSAFISQQSSCITGLESCEMCTRAECEKCITRSDEASISSSYHLKLSKINLAMKKLKDDIKVGELKKKSSVNVQKSSKPKLQKSQV